MSEQMNIQWFPGHMAKTRRLIKESLSLVDCVLEILDARIPESSRNPDIDELCASKPRIILLNKCDLADEKITRKWIDHYIKQGFSSFDADCKSGKGLGSFSPLVKKALHDKIARYEAKGMSGRTLRVMVVGIPNCGKSTFINRFSGEKHAKAENRPGVTKGRQWIRVGGIELLDTPGILWPRFEDKTVGERLAFVGSVKDDIIDTEWLALRLLEELLPCYAEKIAARYKISEDLPGNSFGLLQLIAKRRGLLIQGGEPDLQRASILLLDEFRGGKIGRISLETPSLETP